MALTQINPPSIPNGLASRRMQPPHNKRLSEMTADEVRTRAAELREAADAATVPEHREALLRLARRLEQFAEQR